MPIASLTTSEAEVAEMHREAAEGHITAAPFLRDLVVGLRAPFRGKLQAQIRSGCAGAGRRGSSLFPGSSGDARSGALRIRRSGAGAEGAARLGIRRHRRAGSGSIRKTTTPICGRGSRDWTNSPGSRQSGILACGSSRTPTVSYRALTTGRSTTFRRLATEVLSVGAGGWRSKSFAIFVVYASCRSSPGQRTRQAGRAPSSHRLHGRDALAGPRMLERWLRRDAAGRRA